MNKQLNFLPDACSHTINLAKLESKLKKSTSELQTILQSLGLNKEAYFTTTKTSQRDTNLQKIMHTVNLNEQQNPSPMHNFRVVIIYSEQ